MLDTATPLLTTPEKAELYRTALDMLNRSGVPYMVGGTYAFQDYAGIARSTKDFDIFVRPRVSISVSSQPMSFDDTIAKAEKLCEVIGMDDARIQAWVDAKDYEDVLKSNCLQTGKVDSKYYSVDVRNSFDSAKPWRVLFEVSFESTKK